MSTKRRTAGRLRTKLTPPRLKESLVARERLLSRLDAGFEHKLTLVSAPAGFGKTTLVREWIARRTANTRSLSLAGSAVPSTAYNAAPSTTKDAVPDGEGREQVPPAGWVSLDEGDNDPTRFWRYIITACHSFAPDVGDVALNMLRRRQQVPLEAGAYTARRAGVSGPSGA